MPNKTEIIDRLCSKYPEIIELGLKPSRLIKVAERVGIAVNEATPPFVCPICRKVVSKGQIQQHHCLPIWAGGGGREVGNILPLCPDCHRAADTLAQIGYIIRPFEFESTIVPSPWLDEIDRILLTDDRVANQGRFYLAQAHVVKGVRRRVRVPHGVVRRNRGHLDIEVIACANEWEGKIRRHFGTIYNSKLPPNTSCRSHRTMDVSRRWY